MYRAPEPFMAPILWPLTVSRSTPRALGVKGSLRKPWMASVWSRAAERRALRTWAASPTGWTAPVSLFTSIMDTRTVSGRRAASRSASRTRPSGPGVR